MSTALFTSKISKRPLPLCHRILCWLEDAGLEIRLSSQNLKHEAFSVYGNDICNPVSFESVPLHLAADLSPVCAPTERLASSSEGRFPSDVHPWLEMPMQ